MSVESGSGIDDEDGGSRTSFSSVAGVCGVLGVSVELGELIGSSSFGGLTEEGVVGFEEDVLRMGMLELL